MTEQHPITPPPELIEEWIELSRPTPASCFNLNVIATYAARWGADEELDACCEWIDGEIGAIDTKDLRVARRPKPPSLKEQAFKILGSFHNGIGIQLTSHEVNTIRKALEQFDD